MITPELQQQIERIQQLPRPQQKFVKPLTPLQIAATEIIPQGVSIALSIRKLIRQGYLFSAAILTRQLIERTGTIHYLAAHPEAVSSDIETFSR